MHSSPASSRHLGRSIKTRGTGPNLPVWLNVTLKRFILGAKATREQGYGITFSQKKQLAGEEILEVTSGLLP